ncbi:MAG: glycosyltransferase family 4 protein [Aequorivita sp.]
MNQRKRLLYIGNKLSKKGSTITSIETLGSFLVKEGYSIISASSKKIKVLRLLDMIFTLIKNRNDVSFVLIDTYSTQNFYYAIIIGRLCSLYKLPYIPILRGGNLPNRLNTDTRLSRRFFGESFTNVAPSKYLLEQFQMQDIKNLTYIPNTIEIENYPFKNKGSVKAKLLWVRSFSEIYNPLLALEIVEILLKKEIDVSLCMVGPDKDGSMARCKKVASQLNLPVTFTGMLQKEEWVSLSKDYDIFINTTNFDNMPVSVMEAMALGLPVISTDVGGLPFLIENKIDGILVPPDNSEAFVDAIIELLNYPLKVQNVTQNARTKMENFDWEKVKHKWYELLGE